MSNMGRKFTTTCAAALMALTAPLAASAETLKMGLLVPGSVSEEGWNRIGYNALKKVEETLGAEISYVELQQNPASFEKAFRDYASQGYDVILGHGFEFQDAALDVSIDYPDTVFLISSSDIHEDNVIGLNTDTSQPFYLMGVVAARMGTQGRPRRRHGDPADPAGLRGLHQRGEEREPRHPDQRGLHRQLHRHLGRQGIRPQHDRARRRFPDPERLRRDGRRLPGGRRIRPRDQHLLIFSDFTEVAPDNILGLYVADYAAGVAQVVAGIQDGIIPEDNIEFGLKDAAVMHSPSATTPPTRCRLRSAPKSRRSGRRSPPARSRPAPADGSSSRIAVPEPAPRIGAGRRPGGPPPPVLSRHEGSPCSWMPPPPPGRTVPSGPSPGGSPPRPACWSCPPPRC